MRGLAVANRSGRYGICLSSEAMKLALGFLAGIVVAQVLTAGGVLSPADLHGAAPALERGGAFEATRRLTQVPAALDLPRHARERAVHGLPMDGEEVAVPLESALGVWVVEASLNGGEAARFLVDTGSSVVIVAPGIAAAAGIVAAANAPRIELQTVAGRSSGPTVQICSLRVGELELHDVPIVLHDPGPGFDGILGNAFLSRYRLTLDPDRHLLVLRPLDSGLAPVSSGRVGDRQGGAAPGAWRAPARASGLPGAPPYRPPRAD
jgi:clan AA aspartic protease (TIGR02281 family)